MVRQERVRGNTAAVVAVVAFAGDGVASDGDEVVAAEDDGAAENVAISSG